MTVREIVARTSDIMRKLKNFKIFGVLFSFIFSLKSLRILSTDCIEEVFELVDENVIIL